jgi:ubiquinone/menaquinone biosynthesis C-methylase UbiE
MSFKSFYEDKTFSRYEEEGFTDSNPLIKLAWEVRTARTISVLSKLILSFHKNPILVDIGCAGTWLNESLSNSNANYKYVGFDISFSYLQQSTDTFSSSRVVGDATALPFRNSGIDIAASFETIEHLPKPKRAVLELQRCAKSYIVVSVPIEGISLFGFDKRFDRYIDEREQIIKELIKRVGWNQALRILHKKTGAAHVNFYTKTRFENLFSDSRYKKWRMRGMLFYIPGLDMLIRNKNLKSIYILLERIFFSRIHIFITSVRLLPIGPFGNQYGLLVLERKS